MSLGKSDFSLSEIPNSEADVDSENEREEKREHNVFPDDPEGYDADFDEGFYQLTDVEKKLAKHLNYKWPQLAPFIIFGLSVGYAREIGFIIFGPKGCGKSASLSALSAVPSDVEIRTDQFSVSGISEEDEEMLSNSLSNFHVDDMSTHVRQATGSNMLGFLSQLLFEREFKADTHHLDVEIRNANIFPYMAGTTWCAKTAMSEGAWFSHIVDRFLRLYLNYWNKPDVVTKDPPSIPSGILPTKIKDVEWDVPKDLEKDCVRLMERQFSGSRAKLSVEKVLRGHARMTNRSSVTEKDAKWLLMYEPVIAIESEFVFRLKSRYGSATEPKFSDVYPEVLHHISRDGVMKIGELRRKTELRRSFLSEVLNKLEGVGMVSVDRGNAHRVTISGEWGRQLKRLHRVWSIGGI